MVGETAGLPPGKHRLRAQGRTPGSPKEDRRRALEGRRPLHGPAGTESPPPHNPPRPRDPDGPHEEGSSRAIPAAAAERSRTPRLGGAPHGRDRTRPVGPSLSNPPETPAPAVGGARPKTHGRAALSGPDRLGGRFSEPAHPESPNLPPERSRGGGLAPTGRPPRPTPDRRRPTRGGGIPGPRLGRERGPSRRGRKGPLPLHAARGPRRGSRVTRGPGFRRPIGRPRPPRRRDRPVIPR